MRSHQRQRGFSIIAGIFILVVLAALAGFIVSVTTTQNVTFAQDVQGARAYQAARAGAEYGIARWLSATPSAAADCTAGATTVSLAGTPLAGFTLTVSLAPSSGGGVNFCTITSRASATATAAGSPAFVEREIRVVVEGNRAP